MHAPTERRGRLARDRCQERRMLELQETRTQPLFQGNGTQFTDFSYVSTDACCFTLADINILCRQNNFLLSSTTLGKRKIPFLSRPGQVTSESVLWCNGGRESIRGKHRSTRAAGFSGQIPLNERMTSCNEPSEKRAQELRQQKTNDQ